MGCPRCGSTGKHKVDRTVQRPHAIDRRRQCVSCKYEFTTTEHLSERNLLVQKSDDSVVEFDRAKIRKAIEKAATRKHPEEYLDEVVADIVGDVYAKSDHGKVGSSVIADAVLRRLKDRDESWHIRLALVQFGRRDRTDDRSGWAGVEDVLRWLDDEYHDLEHWKSSATLEYVVKRDRRREQFRRVKLERSIGYASKGRKSPDAVWKLAVEVADDVESALGSQPMATTGQIAGEAMRSLRERDAIAYLRYASSIMRFGSPADYKDEAVALRNRQRGTGHQT